MNKVEKICNNWNTSFKEKGDALLELAKVNGNDYELLTIIINKAIKYYELSDELCLCNLAHCYCIMGELSKAKSEAKEFYQNSIETHINGSKSPKYKNLEFYKFYSVEENSLVSILNTIRLTNPSEFNDPIDCPIIHKNGDNTLIQDKSVFEGLRVGCFGLVDYNKKTNQQPFWKNAKTWTYYANSHKGICIRYMFSENVLEKAMSDRFVFKPVEYKTQFSFYRGIVADGFLSKSIDYADENEWRIVWYDRDYKERYKYIETGPNNIICIYLGYLCDKKIKARIIDFVKKSNPMIRVFQIQSNPTNIFELTKREINVLN